LSGTARILKQAGYKVIQTNRIGQIKACICSEIDFGSKLPSTAFACFFECALN
jgi:hypothetical protein